MPKTENNSGHSTFVHCMFWSTKVTCPQGSLAIEVVSEIKQFPCDFRLLNIEIVTNKYFRNYKRVRSAYSVSLHKRIMYPPCDMLPLCSKQTIWLMAIFSDVYENEFVTETPPVKSDNLVNTARYLTEISISSYTFFIDDDDEQIWEWLPFH